MSISILFLPLKALLTTRLRCLGSEALQDSILVWEGRKSRGRTTRCELRNGVGLAQVQTIGCRNADES